MRVRANGICISDFLKEVHGIGPTSNPFIGSASDGYLWGRDLNYNTARDLAVASAIYPSEDNLIVGQYQEFVTWGYNIFRLALFFDTSAIPVPATIISANLRLKCNQDYSEVNFDIKIQNGQPARPTDPIVVSDYDRTLYSGDGGSWNTVNYLDEQYIEINLNATGLTWIQKGVGAKTKLMLRSSSDINNLAPWWENDEWIRFYSAEAGVGYAPYLDVVYI